MQMQMQMQGQRVEDDNRDRDRDRNIDEDAGKLKYSDLEYERHRSRCLDREWSEKVLLVIGFAILLFGIAILFVDTSPIQAILMKICDFMMSYINFSYKVLCDMISFIVGLLFVGVFIFTIISIIVTLIDEKLVKNKLLAGKIRQ
jgi:hypothetical protein